MVKIKQIPYVKEFVIYCLKCAVFFIVLREALMYLNVFNGQIVLIAVLFLALTFEPLYLMSFLASFFLFLFFSLAIESEFVLLFFYMGYVFVNMMIVMIYLRTKYDLREI